MYLRFAFEKNILKALTDYLSSKIPLFYSQLDEKAGLGCHDFHISIAGKLKLHHAGKIINCMKLYSDFPQSKINISTYRYKVTPSGTVMLLVNKNKYLRQHIVNICKHLSPCNSYTGFMHITIGRYTGKNTAILEELLNIAASACYKLSISRIELDEDAFYDIKPVCFK